MISSWTFFWLVGGEVSGSQHRQPSGSNRSGVNVLITVNFSHLVGVSVSAKILLCIPAPRLHYFFFSFWPHCVACGILVPTPGEPGIEPQATAVKALSPIHWTIKELLTLLFLFTVPPLSPHPLPSLISNCLNLLVGTLGRSWRLNEAEFL